MSVEAGTTKHVLLSAYDDWFLRPLDLISIVLGLFYLYHRAWLLGLFLLAFGNLLGFVGQALNKEQSFRELAHKRHWLTRAEFATRVHEKLGKDGLRLGKAVAATWAALALATALIAIHNGTQKYSAVWVGIEVGFVCQMIFLWGIALVSPLRVASNTASMKKIMWWAWALGPGAIVASNLQGSVLLLFCTAWFAVVFIAYRKRKVLDGQEARQASLPDLHEFGRAERKVQVEATPQKMRGDRNLGTSCDEGLSDEQSRGIDEITREPGFAYQQLKAFDNTFDFDATVLTWRFVHQALEIALGKGYTSTEIARSFTHNLAQAIAESDTIVPERAERGIALNATGLAWRGIHSTLLGILVRVDCRLEQALAMNESQREHIRSFTDRLEVALVGWGVLSVAQVNEIRQQSLNALFEATTIHHGGALPVMTQAIWENEYGGIGLPTEAEIREKHAELQTEIKQREFFAKKLDERAGQAAGNTGARVEQEPSKQTASDTKAAPDRSPWEIRDEDIPF
jgi:hypothetical protein